MTHQHISLDSGERTWQIDVTAAARVAPWISRKPAVFAADLTGMATYFPHWVLAGAFHGKPAICPQCTTVGVPTGGAIRCITCGRSIAADGLIWLGHLPTLARPEPQFERGRVRLRELGFSETSAAGATYLLVPLTVLYPPEWPNVEPTVRYPLRWLEALNLPHSSAAHHLINRGTACIFSYNQWQSMPIHAVLQQRMATHLASLCKVAAGQSPASAFIGRVHSQPWQGA